MKRSLALLMMMMLPAAACRDGGQAAERIPLDGGGAQQAQQGSTMAPEVRALVENGNASYRAGDYQEALAHYQEAARLGPNEATAWYGVAMAASAVGDQELAEQAGTRVHQLNPELGFGRHPGPGEGGEAPPRPPHP